LSKPSKTELQHFRRALTLRVLMQFLITIILYTGALFLLLFLGRFFSGLFIWRGDELLYRLLMFIDINIWEFMIFLCGGGYVVIFIIYWGKTLGYLENVIGALEKVYKSEDEAVKLPGTLREVEMQMNQIRLDLRERERIAREAEQRKSDLVVYLAHDLKTPLTSVIGYLTLLRDEGQISPELREKYLSIALVKAERLEDLINEFFDITRFSLGGLTLEPKLINLTRMLEQISDEFAPMLKEKSLRCTLNSPPDIMLTCDPDKLQRVFDNLLRNAINYSFEASEIIIVVSVDSGTASLSFINHGSTIPKHKLEKIFEQFYRLDSARTSKSGGAGLGLAIAKEIVELHGGSIRAQSENNMIEFSLTLPLHP
jgi:two-component system sensor histidine kinase VanS